MGTSEATGPFYHGTDALLVPGQFIEPADVVGYVANPTCTGRRTDVAFCTEYRRDAQRWGAQLYVVEPVGTLTPDWNGSEGDWQAARLEVVNIAG